MATPLNPSSPFDDISSNLQLFPQSLSTDQTSPCLSSTLSSLINLLSVCDSTLSSLSSTLQHLPSHSNNVQCPYNPSHSVPAESLFNHTLRCSSSPSPRSPSSLLRSVNYPKTLNFRDIPPETLTEIESDSIRISLNHHYHEFFSNYFYDQCPAVVSLTGASLPNKEFTLPRFLFNECVEGCADAISSENSCHILPSDVLSLRKEIHEWVNFPESYSYSSLCAILRLHLVEDNHLKRWIPTVSSKFGVFIDSFTNDNLLLLFKLGFLSIRREGYASSMELKRSEFECSILSRTLVWLSSQFSILYGSENSNSFVLRIFKECVKKVADEALVEFLGIETPKDQTTTPPNNHKGEISLSQLVSAIAGLHERYFLDQHLRILKSSYLPAVQQRLTEYVLECEIANSERRGRDFKAVIEHDGFLRRNVNNQGESYNCKTREELLARERDYKRRRASYKGKKMKRNSVQVMKDVIDEYMQEIKNAY